MAPSLSTGIVTEGVAFTHDGKTVYAANAGTFNVSVIDVASRSVVNELSVADGPRRVGWVQTNAEASATGTGSGDENFNGGRFGGGVEAMFAGNIGVRGEYTYTIYENIDVVPGLNVDPDQHLFRTPVPANLAGDFISSFFSLVNQRFYHECRHEQQERQEPDYDYPDSN